VRRQPLREKHVRGAGADQPSNTARRIEIGGSPERTRSVNRPVGGRGNTAAALAPQAAGLSNPNEVARPVQLPHEHIGRVSDAGQRERTWTGIEIGRSEVGPDGVHAAIRAERQLAAAVVVPTSHAPGPNEVPRRVQPRNKGIGQAGTGEIQRARAGIEVGRATEAARNHNRIVAAERHVIGPVARRASPSDGPDKVARPVQLADERIVGPGAG